MRDDFAVMILSHGRAGKVKTVNALNKRNYTGKWYIIIDSDDEQSSQYKAIYGEDHIIVFDKREARHLFDMMDNFDGDKLTVFARNAFWQIARDLNLKYFLELDDDYSDFTCRYEKDNKLCCAYPSSLDPIFDAYIEFLSIPGVDCVCLSQPGDFIGGLGSSMWNDIYKRKAMNAFFCDVDKPFSFIGRYNDDVNAYIEHGKRGKFMITFRDFSISADGTQSTGGGLTESYLNSGTYMKSWYSVMLCPSSVEICDMGPSHRRIHHRIYWDKTCPKLISSKFKMKNE